MFPFFLHLRLSFSRSALFFLRSLALTTTAREGRVIAFLRFKIAFQMQAVDLHLLYSILENV
jgi:hypothetical protein